MDVRATRVICLAFKTEEQARRFDAAMSCRTAIIPMLPLDVCPGDEHLDLALAIEYLAARAINARPFSGNGDPDAFPAKVEVLP